MSNEQILLDWAAVRAGLDQALGLLSDDQLRFTPREGLRSIGEVACHIASCEETWLRDVVYGRTPPTWAPVDYAEHPTVEAIKAALATVHARTETQLADADLAQEVTLPWGNRCQLRQAVWHVLEHEIHHRGEIYLMLGLLGIEGPDV